MTRSRAEQFLHKSISAMIAAIELYNKPYYKYREKNFSILGTHGNFCLKHEFLLV